MKTACHGLAPSDLDAIAVRDAIAVHEGAIDVGMLDGKTERLKADISAEDLQSLLTINGNERNQLGSAKKIGRISLTKNWMTQT